MEDKELRIGQSKGNKKDVKVFKVYCSSERFAQEPSWGPVVTNNRTSPQKQDKLDVTDRLEEMKKLEVTAMGEWANILVIPSYPALVPSKGPDK